MQYTFLLSPKTLQLMNIYLNFIRAKIVSSAVSQKYSSPKTEAINESRISSPLMESAASFNSAESYLHSLLMLMSSLRQSAYSTSRSPPYMFNFKILVGRKWTSSNRDLFINSLQYIVGGVCWCYCILCKEAIAPTHKPQPSPQPNFIIRMTCVSVLFETSKMVYHKYVEFVLRYEIMYGSTSQCH